MDPQDRRKRSCHRKVRSEIHADRDGIPDVRLGAATDYNAPPANRPDGRLFITLDSAAMPNDDARAPRSVSSPAHANPNPAHDLLRSCPVERLD